MATLAAHQTSTRSQKNDSREGYFWCKIGLVVNTVKMNVHCIKPQFAPVSGLFAAEKGAFCRKMGCILVLNAVHFGAKRSTFWY